MKYDEAIGEEICNRLAAGETLLAICAEKKDGHPSFAQVMAWCRTVPIFAKAYKTARAASADALAEKLQDAAETEPDPSRARVKCESYKWLASKFKPDVYGEKVDINVNGQIDLVAAISEAKDRTMRLGCDQAPMIDAEYEEIRGFEPDSPTDKQSDSADDDIFS